MLSETAHYAGTFDDMKRNMESRLLETSILILGNPLISFLETCIPCSAFLRLVLLINLFLSYTFNLLLQQPVDQFNSTL